MLRHDYVITDLNNFLPNLPTIVFFPFYSRAVTNIFASIKNTNWKILVKDMINLKIYEKLCFWRAPLV